MAQFTRQRLTWTAPIVRKPDPSSVSETPKQTGASADNSNHIIDLLSILASDPSPSRGLEMPENTFEQHQIKKHEALRKLARLQSNSAIWRMFASLNRELPDGTRDQILRAAQKFANLLLPVFVKIRFEEAKLTNYAKYLREAATRDPFLENASLTRERLPEWVKSKAILGLSSAAIIHFCESLEAFAVLGASH
jgi:hypothetical protein